MTEEAVNWTGAVKRTDFVHTCDGDYVVYITDKIYGGYCIDGKLRYGPGSLVKCESDKSTRWAKLAKLARSMLNPWRPVKEEGGKND